MIYKGYAGLKGKKNSENISSKFLKNRCLATIKLIISLFAEPKMISWHGLIFKGLDSFWKNIRAFAFENRTMFELFFIALYSVEQFLLILFSYKAKDLQEQGFIISIFAIIVLATFAVHKLLMESRIKFLENKATEAESNKIALEEKNLNLMHSYQYLLQRFETYISKGLNPRVNSKNQKRSL